MQSWSRATVREEGWGCSTEAGIWGCRKCSGLRPCRQLQPDHCSAKRLQGWTPLHERYRRTPHCELQAARVESGPVPSVPNTASPVPPGPNTKAGEGTAEGTEASTSAGQSRRNPGGAAGRGPRAAGRGMGAPRPAQLGHRGNFSPQAIRSAPATSTPDDPPKSLTSTADNGGRSLGRDALRAPLGAVVLRQLPAFTGSPAPRLGGGRAAGVPPVQSGALCSSWI